MLTMGDDAHIPDIGRAVHKAPDLICSVVISTQSKYSSSEFSRAILAYCEIPAHTDKMDSIRSDNWITYTMVLIQKKCDRLDSTLQPLLGNAKYIHWDVST
jgi:hypothetical protein